MKFPLPAGHCFGSNPFDVKVHNGNDNWADETNLKHWQSKYALRWDRESPVTGRFDGPCQRACIAVQREYGLPITAVLDADTWTAGLRGPRATLSADHDVPVPSSTPDTAEAPERHSGASGDSGAEGASVAEAPEDHPGASQSDILVNDAETVPDWFDPHKPLGPRSSGPAVRRVRTILGLQPRDTWSDNVTVRIRGLQKVNRLPVTGMVDTNTARLLDSLASKR